MMDQPANVLGYNCDLLNHWETIFWRCGCAIINVSIDGRLETIERKFNAFFGVKARYCAALWMEIGENLPLRAKPKHILSALLFLRRYHVEHVNACLTGLCETTFRKWSWTFVMLIAQIDTLIKFDQRFDEAPQDTNFYVSLDGTDCPIEEPSDFSPRWYSHKLNGPGIKYEIGINVRTGDIVWINGGVPCGEFSDLKLARESFVGYLGEGEYAVADDTYKDARYFIYPSGDPESAVIQKKIMARHETVNGRFKTWCLLSHVYRHSLEDHEVCFKAIANIEQLKINFGDRPYDL